MKVELIHKHAWPPTRAAARRAIFEFIEVDYNQQRMHSSINYQRRRTTKGDFTESTRSPARRHSQRVRRIGSSELPANVVLLFVAGTAGLFVFLPDVSISAAALWVPFLGQLVAAPDGIAGSLALSEGLLALGSALGFSLVFGCLAAHYVDQERAVLRPTT